MEIPLLCNSCHSKVDGIAYRTSCFHLFCPSCAKQIFSDGFTCNICTSVLSKGDVREVVIGAPSNPDISDAFYQMAIASTSFESITQNLQRIRHVMANIEQFVTIQLLYCIEITEGNRLEILRSNDALSSTLVRFILCLIN